MTTVENQNSVDKKPTEDQSRIDVQDLKSSLQSFGEKSDITDEDEQKVKQVIRNLVDVNLPIGEIESMLAKLPLDKRFVIEKMILDQQKNQIATMSQEKYKQYLQAQFPSGVPTSVSEMAISMVSDTSEMYKTAHKEIEKTHAGESPSLNVKQALVEDRALATGAANKAKYDAETLAKNIADIPNEVHKV